MNDAAPNITLDAQPCLACGRSNPPDARFCCGCGAPMGREDVAMASVPPSAPPTPMADPLVGRVIADRYRILSLLGRGGMGVVYKVEHIHIGKLMAMKLLHGELARDRDTIRRFRREAEAASKLSHRNTVQIFDFGRSHGMMYLVMEYLPGRDFAWLIQHEGPLDFTRVAAILEQACSSVAEAHRAGIVHRDIKPENIMLAEAAEGTEVVKVLDFGLAKLRETAEEEAAGMSLTRAGTIIGTPYYMAPEHIRGERVDQRTDLYALGAVIYKACVGVPPFWAPSPMGVLTKHLTEAVVPPTERSPRRDLPPDVDAIVIKAMQKDPADRYQSAEEMRADLLSYLQSVGIFVEEPSSQSTSLSQSQSAARAKDVATKGDVDRYERRLRRMNYAVYILLAAFAGALSVGALWLWRQRPQSVVASSEKEPNNELPQAHSLPEGFVVRGYLGKRRTAQYGDLDVYRIDNPAGVRRAIELRVTGIANIDIEVDVIRAGSPTPLIQVNDRPRGLGESLPNFPFEAGTYFVRVREHLRQGDLPTENISDPYRISWRTLQADPSVEVEINDSLELATPIRAGVPVHGFLGWGADVDAYCISNGPARLRAAVTAPSGIDVVLRTVRRSLSQSRKIDAKGIHETETSEVLENASDMCFEVSASSLRGERANPDETYRLSLEAVP